MNIYSKDFSSLCICNSDTLVRLFVNSLCVYCEVYNMKTRLFHAALVSWIKLVTEKYALLCMPR